MFCPRSYDHQLAGLALECSSIDLNPVLCPLDLNTSAVTTDGPKMFLEYFILSST